MENEEKDVQDAKMKEKNKKTDDYINGRFG